MQVLAKRLHRMHVKTFPQPKSGRMLAKFSPPQGYTQYSKISSGGAYI